MATVTEVRIKLEAALALAIELETTPRQLTASERVAIDGLARDLFGVGKPKRYENRSILISELPEMFADPKLAGRITLLTQDAQTGFAWIRYQID